MMKTTRFWVNIAVCVLSSLIYEHLKKHGYQTDISSYEFLVAMIAIQALSHACSAREKDNN